MGTQPAPFLRKTYDIVDDTASNPVVSWASGGCSFVVWKPAEFSKDLLPRFFKHNNFSSFVRQLNTYGFRKVDPDAWEFANKYFVKSNRSALISIQRRKVANSSINLQAPDDPSAHSPQKSSKMPQAAEKDATAWYGSMHDYSGALHAAADLLAFSNKAADQATHLSSSPPGSPVAGSADANAYGASPFRNCLLPQFLPLDLRTHQYASQQLGHGTPAEQQHQQPHNEAAAAWPSGSPPLGVGATPTNQADHGVRSQCFEVSMPAFQKASRDAADMVHLGHACFLSCTASNGAAPMRSSQTAAGLVHPSMGRSSSGLGSLPEADQLDGHHVKWRRGITSDGAKPAKQGLHWPIPLLPLGPHVYPAPYGGTDISHEVSIKLETLTRSMNGNLAQLHGSDRSNNCGMAEAHRHSQTPTLHPPSYLTHAMHSKDRLPSIASCLPSSQHDQGKARVRAEGAGVPGGEQMQQEQLMHGALFQVILQQLAAQERHLVEVQQREGGLLSRIARLESQVSQFSGLVSSSNHQTAFALGPPSTKAGAAPVAVSTAASNPVINS